MATISLNFNLKCYYDGKINSLFLTRLLFFGFLKQVQQVILTMIIWFESVSIIKYM